MRPIHVVVLLLGGAVGGALIMKVMHPGQPLIPVADAVEVQPVVAEQPAPAEPEPEATPPIVAVVTKPSPMPRAVPKPEPVRPLAPVLAVVLHPPNLQPEIAEPDPIVAPPPASPEPEQMTPVAPQASAAPIPQPHQVTLNAGLFLPVRLVDGLSSERNAPGDSFAATLDKEVVADGFVIAERGAPVANGQTVKIVRVVGTQFYVAPI